MCMYNDSHFYLPMVKSYLDILIFLQFNGDERICRPCFQRAQRRFQNNEEVSRQQPTHSDQHQPTEESRDETIQDDSTNEHHSIQQPGLLVQDQAVQVDRVQMVEIPGYTRAPFNCQLCIYANCNNRNLQRIHDDLRAT